MTFKEWKFLLLIITIFITACIETDIYLPAFTDMMAYFHVSEDTIQSLLTWNFVGFCVAGPFYGPLSDAYGRRKPLLVALGIFLIGSIITLSSHTFTGMLIGRVLQGLGTGGCFTLGTAIIFDIFQQNKAIEALNRINTICPFIMAMAPMAGGYLNNHFGFRSNFIAIATGVLASLLITLFFFSETLPSSKRTPFSLPKLLSDFKKVGASLPFWQTTVIVSVPFAGYLAFLSGISVLYILEFHIPKASLPYHQAAMLGSWLAASLTFKPYLKRYSIPNVKFVGTSLMLTGAVILAAACWIAPANPFVMTAALCFVAFGANWSQGLYFPECMELFPDIRGITASMLTSARLLITAATVGIASVLYNGTIYPIAGVVTAAIIIALMTTLWYERQRKAVCAEN